MAPQRIRAVRRPLVLYLAAVVGPTLVVLTLGVIAARRQVAALDALKLTTERLQESSLAIEFERSLAARTAAALVDPVFDELAHAAGVDDPRLLDRAQQHALALPTRYPFARFAFVVIDGEVRYPRVQAPWPQDVPSQLAAESPTARRSFAGAHEREAAGAYVLAAAEYATFEHLARSESLRGLAVASRASMLERAGIRTEAISAYQRLLDQFADAYSPAGRPFSLLAALELARLGQAADPRLRHTRKDLVSGRWSVTHDQATYFLERLPAPSAPGIVTPFLDGASAARRLLSFSIPRTDAMPGHVSFAAIGEGDGILQLAYRGDQSNRTVGIVLSLPWLRQHLLREVAGGVVADRSAELVPLAAGHPPFHAILPGWCIRLLPSSQNRSWLRADFGAFAAIAVVVLGVLVMGVLVLMRDVERETKLNQLRADLVGGVSHELKTPLSVIRIYAETIDEAPDVSTADRRRFAAAIVQETERLRRLVDGVIDFSRIQQGKRDYSLMAGSVAPLVARTADRFRDYLAVHEFSLQATIDSKVPLVEFDEIAVEQAVLNLLDNAFKYSGESRELSLDVGTDGESVFIRVQDQGVGIAPSEQSRIFERFQRGDHPDRGGYGLGLYLVRHIMAAHRGRVDLASMPGKGSTFTLVFPRASTIASSAEVSAAGRRPSVLSEPPKVSYVESTARRG